MKKTLLIALLLTAGNLLAQTPISINQNDMPDAGDTLRVSMAAPALNFNLQSTGANHTWDFSSLQPVSQQVESFISVGSTGFTFQLFFNNQFLAPSTFSTIASPAQLPAQMAGLGVSNPVGFFRETSTQFHQTGWGGNLNGSDVPVTFNNVDVIYKFPLNYQTTSTSASDYEASAPGMGFLGHQQTRNNTADGWGTLITPFGTFEVLRVVSVIAATDTIFLNGQGIKIVQPLTREYKWLAKNTGALKMGIPVLQITTQEFQGAEVPSQVKYRDQYRNLTPMALEDNFAAKILAGPNPFSDELMILLPENTEVKITLFDALGREVRSATTSGREKMLPTSGLGKGIYFLTITDGKNTRVQKLVRN
ncbi:MAG: T9SS type A sorting domain-containing protein [Chitinophagaceae bacterium]|nr:MAG: T9SS type A sorting domain-containing protein [Chitinophagaceae bacterium]